MQSYDVVAIGHLDKGRIVRGSESREAVGGAVYYSGVVHTHSTYATVFAVLGRELPVYTTELADLFGGPIPISEYVPPGDRGIGVEFAEKTRPGRYRALLMLSHGVFTSGKTPADAVKAAVIVEHSAKVAYLTELLGKPKLLPSEEVEELHRRYVSRYGQRKEGDG